MSWNNSDMKLIADLLLLWKALQLRQAEIILNLPLQKKKKKEYNLLESEL